MDSGTAGSKQEKCDEISNAMKIMLIKTCWKKGFIHMNIQDLQPAEAVGATKCSQNNATRRTRSVKYSHIPRTMNQELLQDAKHVQEQCNEITLNMFGSVHKRHRQDHTPTTTKRFGALP